MSAAPRVSVVVPCCNAARYLAAAARLLQPAGARHQAAALPWSAAVPCPLWRAGKAAVAVLPIGARLLRKRLDG